MNFCIMSPATGLERYASLGQCHLLLAHIQNEEYWNWYKRQREANDHIILDNGGYEGKPSNTRIIDRIKFLNPQVAVLPDFLCENWKKTYQASMGFLDRYYYEFPQTDWMYVPQSEPGDIVGFIEGLFKALDDERIKWIGLPRALCYSITQDLHIRARIAEKIKHRRNINIHALGMVKGNVAELNLLRETHCVASCDSNAPVWRGWNNSDLLLPWNERPCDYDATDVPDPNSSRDALIKHNLWECGIRWTHTS
jgi:hypothetical protein